MRLLRTDEVLDLTGLSRSTIWRLERKKDFPSRIHLGPNAVGWDEDEVHSWIASRPRGIRSRQTAMPYSR
jgi:predicted DNA-binding transcriptional regulator AlpA